MARLQNIFETFNKRNSDPTTGTNTFSLDIHNSIFKTIKKMDCEYFVKLNHQIENFHERIDEAIAWCDNNCKYDYYYDVTSAQLCDNGDIVYDPYDGTEMCIFVFRDREDCYSFHLFFN